MILSPSRQAMFRAATVDAYDAEKKGTGPSQALDDLEHFRVREDPCVIGATR